MRWQRCEDRGRTTSADIVSRMQCSALFSARLMFQHRQRGALLIRERYSQSGACSVPGLQRITTRLGCSRMYRNSCRGRDTRPSYRTPPAVAIGRVAASAIAMPSALARQA